MSDAPVPGRLLLVAARGEGDPHTLARAVAARLDRAVHVDLTAQSDAVVSGGVTTRPPDPRAVEQLYLRWLAGIAVAETYQRAGFDAVLSERVEGDLLDDLLDFVAPTPLHLVVLAGATDGEPDDPGADRPVGLLLATGGGTTPELLDAVRHHLDDVDAVVRTDSSR